MKATTFVGTAVLTLSALHLGSAAAQQPAQEPAAPAATGESALAATAQGVVGNARARHMRALIVGIDAASRTLTLKGAKDFVTNVVVGPEVPGFEKLKVGDRVDVFTRAALLVTADKVDASSDIRESKVTRSITQKPGGFDSTRQVELLATVTRIDRKTRVVTLRGPQYSESYEVSPQLDLAALKVGDTVHAVYVSATAVNVTSQPAQD
jgi:hypothetical protein